MTNDPAAIEREQCAKLCEDIILRYELEVWTVAARACVIAIRARAFTRYFNHQEPETY